MTHIKSVWRTGPTATLSCEENGLLLVVRPSGDGQSIRYSVLMQPKVANTAGILLVSGIEATTMEAMAAAEGYAARWQRAGATGAECHQVAIA